MQITNFSTANTPFTFGMRVSKLGRQIDKVLEQNGSNNNDVNRLRLMFEDYFVRDLNESNTLGKGFYGCVYSIDDKYVFKCKNGETPDAEIGAFKLAPKAFRENLSGLKTYFGGILMQLGNVAILRNVSSDGKHIPAGIPRAMLSKFPNDELVVYYNSIYLPIFANLPQRSFDGLAKDFDYLNKKAVIITVYSLM